MTAYRNSSYAVLIAVVAVFFFAASIIGVASKGGSWAPVVVVGALSLFCLTRLARAGVYADHERVRIVNPLKTVTVPWEHVLRFTLKPSKGFPAVAFAELIDGREIQVWGIQARSYSAAAKRIPEQVVADLNERLASERAARQPTP